VIATRRFLYGIQEDGQCAKCNTPLSEPMRINVTVIVYCIFALIMNIHYCKSAPNMFDFGHKY